MANTTPTTPNTTDSGHPGNSMTHTGVDAHEGSTVTSNPDEHSHLHYDDGYKLHFGEIASLFEDIQACLLYTSPSPRDATLSRMPSSA